MQLKQSLAFFTNSRSCTDNFLNLSHLNNRCCLFLHAKQLFVPLTTKTLLDIRPLLERGVNLSSSCLDASRARLETRTAVLYKNSYKSSIFGKSSRSNVSSHFSAVIFGNLLSNRLTSISDPTFTSSAFKDATCCCVSSASLDKPSVDSFSTIDRFKSSERRVVDDEILKSALLRMLFLIIPMPWHNLIPRLIEFLIY